MVEQKIVTRQPLVQSLSLPSWSCGSDSWLVLIIEVRGYYWSRMDVTIIIINIWWRMNVTDSRNLLATIVGSRNFSKNDGFWPSFLVKCQHFHHFISKIPSKRTFQINFSLEMSTFLTQTGSSQHFYDKCWHFWLKLLEVVIFLKNYGLSQKCRQFTDIWTTNDHSSTSPSSPKSL